MNEIYKRFIEKEKMMTWQTVGVRAWKRFPQIPSDIIKHSL